jgi:hypothetical protein
MKKFSEVRVVIESTVAFDDAVIDIRTNEYR